MKPIAWHGLSAEQQFLSKTAKVDTGQLVLNDGQGGSPTDLVTPQAVVDLLRYMAGRPDFARYEPVLPILGVDGSLADVQSGTPAAGHVFAKTGTLASGDILNNRFVLTDKALGGYIDTKDGRMLAFSLIVNNVPLTRDQPGARGQRRPRRRSAHSSGRVSTECASVSRAR